MIHAFHVAALAQGVPIPEIEDIAGAERIPWAWWQVALLAAATLALLALGIWLAIRWWRRRPAMPPLTPRAAAFRELERLRAQVHTLDPHTFSVAVSEVLRRFVGAQFGLHAERQTTPEFLEASRQVAAFAEEDRALLADFLERCDLVKFARIGADESTSEALLGSAMAFVQGSRSGAGVVAGAGGNATANTHRERGGGNPPPLPRA